MILVFVVVVVAVAFDLNGFCGHLLSLKPNRFLDLLHSKLGQRRL